MWYRCFLNSLRGAVSCLYGGDFVGGIGTDADTEDVGDSKVSPWNSPEESEQAVEFFTTEEKKYLFVNMLIIVLL